MTDMLNKSNFDMLDFCCYKEHYLRVSIVLHTLLFIEHSTDGNISISANHSFYFNETTVHTYLSYRLINFLKVTFYNEKQ